MMNQGPATRKNLRDSKERKERNAWASDVSEVKERIKFMVSKNDSAPRGILWILWITNFLQLEDKKRERFISSNYMAIDGKKKRILQLDTCKLLKMSLWLQEEKDRESEARVDLRQQENELIDGYITHYLKIRRMNEKWRTLLDARIFVQGLESKLLNNILKINNSISWREVLHELQEYSKLKRK